MKINFFSAKNKLGNSKGFILITSYLLLSSLMVFALGLYTWGTSYLQSAERNKKKIMAFNIAEAGFDDAYYRVKNSTISYPWSSGYTSMTSGGFQGGYSTTVTDMGSNVKRIVVTAYSPSQSSTTESVETRTVTGYVQTGGNSAFNFGIFARQSVTLTGNASTDAYDSSNGAYGGSNVFARGSVGTDSITNNTVTLTGNARINGDLTTGVGSTPTSVLSTSGSATVTGTKTAALSSLNPSSVTTSVASSGALAISGNTTLTLAPGTYNYSSLSISGNGRLTTSGAVVIYVSGTISIAGNGVSTASSLPTNMLIYSTGSSSVSFSGNGNIYAGIYAPNSTVTNSGNGTIYGAVVSNVYNQTGNGAIHFDEALQDVAGSGSNATMLSWKESNLTNS